MAKVLIIDDDPDMVLATRLCLVSAGHEVVEAGNGTEGLAKVKSETPDLIILDVMMDTTTEGFHIALTLRSNDPEFAPRNIPSTTTPTAGSKFFSTSATPIPRIKMAATPPGP